MKQFYEKLPMSEVRLMPGLLKQRSELNRRYMMSLKNQNLLQNHYFEAGLWNSTSTHPVDNEQYDSVDCHWGWESPTCQLRGHFLGHWLSAAAKVYNATGDIEIKAKADKIVAELSRCQKENGGEWIGSIPEKYLNWLEVGKPVWAPQYTLHKTLMGLYDMYEFGGNKEALHILINAADWYIRWTEKFTDEQMNKILDIETGGMLEVWANLYGVTNNESHLKLLKKYDRRFLFDRLISGEEVLTNMHANTTIPEILGAARAFEVTGEERYKAAVIAYWKSAVTDRGSYCTGGQSSGELWSSPFELSPRLGEESQELCTVYNMILLAERLLLWTGDVKYADYIERNLYNGILAQQNETTGMPIYYLPMQPGGVKKWGTPTRDFWCCHGTLIQSYSKNEGIIYYKHADGIMVSQYFPSELNSEFNGKKISIRQERHQNRRNKYSVMNIDGESTLNRKALTMNFTVKCEEPLEFSLKFRIPWWVKNAASITINGNEHKISSGPSSFYEVRRTWHEDTIRIEFPKSLTCCPLPDMPSMVAFMEGPVVLAGLTDNERIIYGDIGKPENILRPLDEVCDKWDMMGYYTKNQSVNFKFMPLYKITDEKYTIYFPIEDK